LVQTRVRMMPALKALREPFGISAVGLMVVGQGGGRKRGGNG